STGRKSLGCLVVGDGQVLDHLRFDLHLSALERQRDAMMSVQHVVAKAELVDLDQRQGDVGTDRPPQSAETGFVVSAAPSLGRTKVSAKLVAAVHAADDARHFDCAYSKVALDQHAGALSVLVEAAQLSALERLAAWVHQEHRTRCGASHLVGDA